MRKGRLVWILIIILLVISWLYRRTANHKPGGRQVETEQVSKDPSGKGDRREEINRNATDLIYSKHARCRMGCRHISEEEVLGILQKGRINYKKSDLRADPDPKYALEGTTVDGQEVRIVFANSPRGIVVVTVIDLDNEWKCDCK